MKRRLAWVALLIPALLAGCQREQSAAQLETRVNAEINRVSAALTDLERADINPEIKDLPKMHRELLGRAQSGRTPLLRLYRLRHPYVGAETVNFIRHNKPAAQDLAKFEELWKKHQADFAQRPKMDGGKSVLHRAMIQGAQNRAEKLFKASLPYGKASGAFSGTYYLAEAQANLRFRDFLQSLPDIGKEEKPPRREELEAELRRIDDESLEFFKKDPVSRNAIQTSALLKEAREQLDGNLLDGATLTLLEARMELSRRKATPGPVKAAATNVQKESVAAVFEQAANDRQDEVGQAIRADVIPMYARLYKVSEANRIPRPAVVVTLVRWPYT